jgi:hypothetical protein
MLSYRHIVLAVVACSMMFCAGIASAGTTRGTTRCSKRTTAHHKHGCSDRRKKLRIKSGVSPEPPQPSVHKEPCLAVPAPSEVPSGDGWLVGGDYMSGGAPPGIFDCVAEERTLEVFAATTGNLVATAHVSAGANYAVVLPAGSYRLQAGGCQGAATIVVGRETSANTVCDIP